MIKIKRDEKFWASMTDRKAFVIAGIVFVGANIAYIAGMHAICGC